MFDAVQLLVQNDSMTLEGINPELMDRLMGEKEEGRDDDREGEEERG